MPNITFISLWWKEEMISVEEKDSDNKCLRILCVPMPTYANSILISFH